MYCALFCNFNLQIQYIMLSDWISVGLQGLLERPVICAVFTREDWSSLPALWKQEFSMSSADPDIAKLQFQL
jgi:hypothetical protein